MESLDQDWRKRVLDLYGEHGSDREHRHMEIAGVQFLLWKKKCVLFARERSAWLSQPDLFAVDKSGWTYEIEIKCSVADFRRNKQKQSQQYLRQFPEKGPHYFYYLVSPHIWHKVQGEVEPHFGLMTLDCNSAFGVSVIRKATRIHKKKPDLKQMMKLVRDQSGTVLNLMGKLHDVKTENERNTVSK